MVRRLAIVIVNYRTPDLVEACLESLDGQVDPARDRAIVVDSGSGDGSVDAVSAAVEDRSWSGWVTILDTQENRGLSAALNSGIRSVDAESYLLLNSDTLVRPGALPELLRAMDAHPEIGLFGPRLEWPNGDAQESLFRFHNPLSELVRAARTGPITRLLSSSVVALPVPSRPEEFDWASLACLAVRREVIDQVGLLDEGYFLFYEDVDYCRRAREAGVASLFWPDARVVHLRGGSTPVKKLSAARKRPPRYFYASRTRYYAKFYGRSGLLAANLCWCLGRVVSRLRETLTRRPPHLCEREGLDIWTSFWNPLAAEARKEPVQ